MPWLRLYTEIIDDVKLRDCTAEQFRDWIYLLCLARMAEEPGTIRMSVQDAAWRVRRSPDEFRASLELFASRGLVACEDGKIVVCHFLERQYDKPSDTPAATRERQRKARERKQASRDCHAAVTRCHAIDTDPERDLDTEVPPPPLTPPPPTDPARDTRETRDAEAAPEEQGTAPPEDPAAPVVRFCLENFIPTATPYQVDKLAAWVEQDGMEAGLVVWAMEEALRHNVRTIAYVESILANCRNEGIRTRVAAEARKQAHAKGRDSPEEQVERIVSDPEELARLHAELEEALAHGGG